MRFFKYLFSLFILFLSPNIFASYTFYSGPKTDVLYGSPQSACQSLYGNDYKSFTANSNYPGTVDNQNVGYCVYGNYGSMGEYVIYKKDPIKCGKPGTPVHVSFNNMEHIPLTVCTRLEDGRYCVTEGNLNTVSGGGTYLGQTFNPSIIHSSISETPSLTCTPKFSDTKCDNKDPYGGCYVPPNDGCTRHADGSIYCPSDIPPPTPNDTCSGATYCKKPPLGCGTGYVSGSFNGEQLCVKSSPSTPSDPSDPNSPQTPNSCDGQYCPKPDPDKECPTGYYSSYYNGSPICVANNPNPNQPNINDPNNNDDAISSPSGGDDPNTTFDTRGIIEAIKALRDSLISAIDNLSKKMTSLVEGQKQTNDKLDTANGHLSKIEENTKASSDSLDSINDATLATSEAIGESNKKLDQIFSDQGKEQIEQLGEQSTDSRLTSAESEMTSKLQTLANTLSYSSSHVCISDFTVTDIPHFGSMTVPLSKWCDLLALVKLLLKLAVLMLALKMIDATVRVF